MPVVQTHAGAPLVVVTSKGARQRKKTAKAKKFVLGASSVLVAGAAKVSGSSRKIRRQHRTNGLVGQGGMQLGAPSGYVNTLNDPFMYPGIPLGFGCCIPTSLSSVYLKGSFAVNATDGSFSVATIPYAVGTGGTGLQGAILGTSISGASTAAAYTFQAASNNINLLTTASFGRVISGGLRVFVRYPATSAAGIMNAWPYSSSNSSVTNSSPVFALSYPQSVMCGKDEVTILYRPTDFGDFNFQSLSNGALTNTLASWVGVIQGMGYPATSTTVFYEAIYHLETYATTQIVSGDIAPSMIPTVSDYFPSVETAMKFARQHLTADVVQSASDVLFKGAPVLLASTAARRMIH
jgi:hypothetical protein